MRYFYYVKPYNHESTVIIVDESSDDVTLFPARLNYSYRKTDWLDHYRCSRGGGEEKLMYEICENQFHKFATANVVPTNWEGVWPYTKSDEGA